MGEDEKPLIWLSGEIKSPPFSALARRKTGLLLRALQDGALLEMPDPRPMPAVGKRCHELRIKDRAADWRILLRVDVDAIVIVEVFAKKTQRTPKQILETCRYRLDDYDAS